MIQFWELISRQFPSLVLSNRLLAKRLLANRLADERCRR